MLRERNLIARVLRYSRLSIGLLGRVIRKRRIWTVVTLSSLVAWRFLASGLLGWVAANGNGVMVRCLVFAGANGNAINNRRTPLLAAVEATKLDAAETLIDLGTDVNLPETENLRSPLMVASYYGEMPVVKLLISHGANINAKDASGRSVLRWADDGQRDGHGDEASTLLRNLGAMDN